MTQNSCVNKYYSILLPSNHNSSNHYNANQNININDLVVTNIKEASKLLKTIKGSRLKMFDNFEDAFICSQKGLIEDNQNQVKTELKIDSEKSSYGDFSSISPQQLAAFRKLIQKNDINSVQDLIWSNPRYLISSGDTPVILMEGPRYNAAHISAKSNKVEILKLILNSISNLTFIKKLYPKDEEIVTKKRASYLLDLYLNTPDKVIFDTPLHFATKFGSLECVQLLLSFPECDKMRNNKLSQTPYDVICSRVQNLNLKTQIEHLFESRYYVTINRNEDRVIIGEPTDVPLLDDTVTGIAGPMSPLLAQELYQSLKSPGKAASPIELQIRLTDASKGIERIARMECQKKDLNWNEYWDFLDCCINLASDQGLKKLERHFRKTYNELLTSDNSLDSKFVDKSTLSLLCEKFDDLNLSTSASYDSPKFKYVQGKYKDFNKVDDKTENGDRDGDGQDENEVFSTPPSSPVFLLDYYIKGLKYSEADKNAAIALSSLTINENEYPFITNWLKRINFKNCILSPISSSPLNSDARTANKLESTPIRSRKSIQLKDLSSLKINLRFSQSEDDTSE